MAYMKAHTPIDMSNNGTWWADFTESTSKRITISDGYNKATYLGSFSYDSYGYVYGNLSAYKQWAGSKLMVEISSINADVNAIFHENYINGDGIAALSLIFDRSDEMHGSDRRDILWGWDGNDRLYGNSGNDVLEGNRGVDKLFGGAGRDRLKGGAANDLLKSGAGSDILKGGKGDDVLVGGGRGDRFIFERGCGDDTIRDFQNGIDHIEIGRGANSFRDLDIYRSGSDTIVEFANVSITFEDTRPGQLDASDFWF